MRQQLNILKEKLQHQAIVNDQIFRRSMKRNVMSINRRYTFISILCILTIPYAYWAFVVMAGMSFYFWLATLVLLLVSFCYTIYNGRNLNSRLVERDLVDARMKVANAKKLDASAFIKALYRITDSWDVFADMQYRHVGYKTDGYNDKFYEDENTGEIMKHYLNIDKKYDFFNPKAGVSFHQDGHRAFFSAALSHREPERNNFTDNGSYPAPKAESLLDFEMGYSYSAQNWRAGATLYYMDYTDQFVQTGAQSDIGEALTTNIKDSYRMGVELTAGVDITPWLSIEGNAALSQNKIKDFDEVVEDWDNGSQTIHYDNSTLAFSPSAILNGFVNFHLKGWTATWHTGYVSRMYLDNTECKDRSLPGYSVSNFNLNYSLPVKKFLKEIVFGANLNNVFNSHFAQSGWVYSAIYSSGGHPNDNRYYQIGFVPSAGFTAMGSITLRF